jgi:hypothetical protein
MHPTLGLLINFNVVLLKDGIKRVIHHPLSNLFPLLGVLGNLASWRSNPSG